MNREIRFRAWCKPSKQFCTNSFIESNLFNLLRIDDRDGGDYVVMQYTGLKDKNGKEIYEGDIIKWKKFSHKHRDGGRHSGCNNVETVEWTMDTYNFSNGWNINRFTTDHICEIIGNIYENPNLL